MTPPSMIQQRDETMSEFVLVPRDNETLDHANTALPIEMVIAGAEAIEECQHDLKNYESGVTPDWDSGMIAVAVYRAMLRAAPKSPSPTGDGEAGKWADKLEGKNITLWWHSDTCGAIQSESLLRSEVDLIVAALRHTQPPQPTEDVKGLVERLDDALHGDMDNPLYLTSCADILKLLRAALRSADSRSSMPAWRTIDTAPKDGSRVLAWSSWWSGPMTVQYYPRGWGYDYDLGPLKFQPTHWMPTPEPPNAALTGAGKGLQTNS